MILQYINWIEIHFDWWFYLAGPRPLNKLTGIVIFYQFDYSVLTEYRFVFLYDFVNHSSFVCRRKGPKNMSDLIECQALIGRRPEENKKLSLTSQ